MTNLYTGAGANVVYVTEIDNNTTINDQSTTDTVDVGFGPGQTYANGNTSHINALLTVSGDNGADVLNVSNKTDATADPTMS